MTNILIISISFIAVGLLLLAEYHGAIRLKWLAKPTASAAFVALAIVCGAPGGVYGALILSGLVFCLAGDVLLIPKSERSFLAGMAAFALGHGAYIAAFASTGMSVTTFSIAGGAATFALIIIVLRWLWPHLGAFRAPVAAYCLIIAAMVAASLATSSPDGDGPNWLLVAGAVGFAISDIAVARDQFVAPGFINRLWGLPLYYGAQLLLASSVCS